MIFSADFLLLCARRKSVAEKVVKFNDDFVGSRGQVEHEGVLWMTRTWRKCMPWWPRRCGMPRGTLRRYSVVCVFLMHTCEILIIPCVCVCVCAYWHTFACVCVWSECVLCVHVDTTEQGCMCTSTYKTAYMYVHTFVCIQVYVCVYIHGYTRIYASIYA